MHLFAFYVFNFWNFVIANILPHDVGDCGGYQAEVKFDFDSEKKK
jgi:hypothetical protein